MTIAKTKKDNPISIGHRVKSARMLSGYTRKSFAIISNISMATLRAWEEPARGRNGLTDKGAKRLIKGLSECGIYCSEPWLLLGIGSGPKIISQKSALPFNEQAEVTWGEEEAILKDIESFKQNNPNPIVAIVTDGGFLPRFSYGDYVGGNKKFGIEIEELLGSDCIVEIGEKTLIRRVAAKSKNFIYINGSKPRCKCI